MKGKYVWVLLVTVGLVSGCATYHRRGVSVERARELEPAFAAGRTNLTAGLKEQILALDSEHVTDRQVRDILSHAPAPRIINIHGGIFPVHTRMISFSKFLIGMGYPEFATTNAADGTYTFSCYESSAKIAGMIAWYYEKEGLRPMIVGHSQGGMQAVKILDKFAGLTTKQIEVWSPLTWEPEGRYEITDPLTGQVRPVVGLTLPFATAVGAGGLTRILPNQWGMNGRLRDIPDSVEDFTGFYKNWDLLGGDWLGFGSANYFESMGTAKVRTIELPAHYHHGRIPDTKHLLASQEMMDWINNYVPPPGPVVVARLDEKFEGDSRHILWAAEVWYGIKKHWVLELQRLIRAENSRPNGH
jgi:hypothetical protein